MPKPGREPGWNFLGSFVVDDTLSELNLEDDGQTTVIRVTAPAGEESPELPDSIGELADRVETYLEEHGRQFDSKNRLKDGLRAAGETFTNDDLGPALKRLQEPRRDRATRAWQQRFWDERVLSLNGPPHDGTNRGRPSLSS